MSNEKNTDSRSSSPEPSTGAVELKKTSVVEKANNSVTVERINGWAAPSELIPSDDDSDDLVPPLSNPYALAQLLAKPQSAPSVMQEKSDIQNPQKAQQPSVVARAISARSPGAIDIPTRSNSVPAEKKGEKTFAHGFNTYVDTEARSRAVAILEQRARAGSAPKEFQHK